jgi:hypothetical protein
LLLHLTINYHRPLVKDRKIWGGLVPYGKVWRTGANENTTIMFSDPVLIEGQPLDKGTYGLHMIPNADEWTIIFSKTSISWGSFTYDQAEDALRVTVKPEPGEMHNALTYSFGQLQPDSAVVELEWEKITVPFKVSDVLRHAVPFVCSPEVHNPSPYPLPTLLPFSAAAHTVLISFSGPNPPTCCTPNRRSNPIAHRVRRKHQRLPASLLIENASDRVPVRRESLLPEAFPIKPSDNPGN